MGSFSYETIGASTFLTYTVGEDENVDTARLGMLANNIEGIAATQFTQMNTTKYLKYDVSGMITISRIFSSTVNKKQVVGILSGIVDALLSADDYMINAESILFDTNYIFVNIGSFRTAMICVPVVPAVSANIDVAAFFKKILMNLRLDLTAESGDYFSRLVNYLNTSTLFSLPDFKSLLETIKKEGTVLYEKEKPQMTPSHTEPEKKAPIEKKNEPVAEQVQKQVQKQAAQVQSKPVMNNIAIPEMNKQPQVVKRTPDVQQNSKAVIEVTVEKPKSMLWLLRNYSKENKEIYDAQKKAYKEYLKNNKDRQPEVKPVQEKSKQSAKVLNQTPDFVIPGMESPVQEEVKNDKKAPSVIKDVQNTGVTGASSRQSGSVADFGDTVYGDQLISGGSYSSDTVIIDSVTPSKALSPYLVRTKTAEKIPVNKIPFNIGREPNYVDYLISDNGYIGHIHAFIQEKDGKYYIVDVNSKNHTYLEGKIINSSTEYTYELIDGTNIKLANEEFTFKLY